MPLSGDDSRVLRREKRFINNPFPRNPRGLGLINGSLLSVLDAQSHPVGAGFVLQWLPANGGAILVFHSSEPNRCIFSTLPGVPFVSGALSSLVIEECRGSVAIHDKIKFICRHQILESITIFNPLDDPDKEDVRNLFKRCEVGEVLGPVLVLSGHLHSCESFAIKQFQALKNNRSDATVKISELNSVEPRFKWACFLHSFGNHSPISVGYTVTFFQTKEHDLQFLVDLEEPEIHPPGSCNSKENRNKPRQSQKNVKYNKPTSFTKKFHVNDAVRNVCLMLKKSKWKLRRVFGNNDSELKVLMKKRQMERLNVIILTLFSQKDERFYGFGEQFSYIDMKGRRLPILVQEQGIGRGDQPITAAANFLSFRSGGNWSTTYAPSPFYMTSTMKCLYLERYDYSVFDLTMEDRLQIQVYGNSLQGRILHGSSPVELIERYTGLIGRMKALPEWIISGAVVGMQGGSNYVRQIWRKLQEYNVPISAFWLQDWVGQRKTAIGSQLWWNWEVDDAHYPEWKQLVQDLKSSGIVTMTYCNPCLVPTDAKVNVKRDYFAEAHALGYFVRNKDHSTYMIPNTSFDVGMLDLTNQSACDWFKGILRAMVETGVRGWMADFGEGLPLDARLHSEEDPISARNKYPQLWAQLNREFVEEWQSHHSKHQKHVQDDCVGSKEDDLVFFMRAGFRDSPKWATLFWEGDQMVSWQRHDGIKSSLVGLLSSGLSGYALNHSDIGGYCTVDLPLSPYKRSEELLMRWMELSSFTTVFRTHEGNAPNANTQFYSNDRVLSHFARFANVYKAWKFYRFQLVQEAATRGLPVVRHLFIHYPDDKYVQRLTYEEFLVGSEMLVIPTVEAGSSEVKAYFPKGDAWLHIWTGHVYGPSQGMGFHAPVAAPLGYPAVFVKVGSTVGATFLNNLRLLSLL